MRTTIRALTAILFMTISTMQAQQAAAPQAPGAGRGTAPATTPAPPPGSAGIYSALVQRSDDANHVSRGPIRCAKVVGV